MFGHFYQYWRGGWRSNGRSKITISAKSSVSIHHPFLTTPGSLERALTGFPSVLPIDPRNPWHLQGLFGSKLVTMLGQERRQVCWLPTWFLFTHLTNYVVVKCIYK